MEFDFFLTRELGYRSVDDMRRRLSAAEHLQWSIFYARKAQRQELAAKSRR